MQRLRSSRSAHRVAPSLDAEAIPPPRYGDFRRSSSAAHLVLSRMPSATAVGSSGAVPAPTRTSDGILAGENFVAWEQSLGQSRTVKSLVAQEKQPKRLKKSSSTSVNSSRQVVKMALSATLASRASRSAVEVDKSSFEPDYDNDEKPWVPKGESNEDVYAGKVQAESELHKARADLKQALIKLDRQRVEIDSLKGLRQVTVRVASDEAIRRGRPHSGHDVLRFSALQKASMPPPPSPFHSDEMDEVAAQAVVATSRRIEIALMDAARVRADSERVDAESMVALEQAFPQRLNGEWTAHEQESRTTTRGILAQSSRSASRLRASLQRLEEEAATAQVVHASDTRALAARLVAQREAVRATLVEGLRACEEDGEFSISGLQTMLKRAEEKASAESTAAKEEIESLRAELAETKVLLMEERAGRRKDTDRLSTMVKGLKADVARLEAELSSSQRRHKADVHFLCKELGGEERGGETYREQEAKRFAAAAKRAEEERNSLEAKLKEVRQQGYEAREAMAQEMRELQHSKEVSEGRLTKELRALEERRQYEFDMLKSRNDTLTQQVLALKANTSTGRQKLYWSSLKGDSRSHNGSLSNSPERSVTLLAASMSSPGLHSSMSVTTPTNPPGITGPGYYRFGSLPSQSSASSAIPHQASGGVPVMMRGGREIQATGGNEEDEQVVHSPLPSPPRRLIRGEPEAATNPSSDSSAQ